MAPKYPILDSHIHLWPASAANVSGHSWMKPKEHLTRQYSLTNYISAVPSELRPAGVIYVETDRALPIPAPPDPATSSDAEFREYVKEPLKEFEFLRRIVEGQGAEEGNTIENGKLLKGIVGWAPIQLGRVGLERYLGIAEGVAGVPTWKLVKGFRYLLQGIKDEPEFRKLALGQDFLEGLQVLGERGFTFDVGVDQRSRGIWQLKAAAAMIEAVRKKEDEKYGEGVHTDGRVRFILNHLCKPDLIGQLQAQDKQDAFYQWSEAIHRLAKCPLVFMKLSGAYSELERQDPAHPTPSSVIVNRLRLWIAVIFEAFDTDRVMFGSDWPVCNVNGPGDEETWKSWYTIVTKSLARASTSEEGLAMIWAGTARKAYNIEDS